MDRWKGLKGVVGENEEGKKRVRTKKVREGRCERGRGRERERDSSVCMFVIYLGGRMIALTRRS